MNKSGTVETRYTEHHSKSYTYKPALIDNDVLNQSQERLEEAQVENKYTEQLFKICQAAIVDSSNSHDATDKSIAELEDIKSYYVTDLEFEEEALPLYLKVCELYENLTERQCKILYKYFIQRYRIVDIAQYYHISAPGVLKTIELIRKKALKLKINQIL